MHLSNLPHELKIVAALCLFALLPGALTLALVDARRRIPATLFAPTALAVSIAIAALVCIAQLTAHWSIGHTQMVYLLVCAALAVAVVGRDLTVRRRRYRRPLTALGALASASVSWLRRMPPVVLAAAAAAAVLGLVLGNRFYADGDSYFHAAVTIKLEDLARPTFDNLGAFRDGDSHPGYHVPVWHDIMALAAHLSHAAPVDVLHVAPALTAPLMVLAWAGLAQVVFRSRDAASLAALAIVAGRLLMTMPAADGISMGAEPRMVAGLTLLPLSWGLVLIAADRFTLRDLDINASGLDRPVEWVYAAALGATTVAAVMVVHVSYGVWVLVGLAGYAAALTAVGGLAGVDRRRAAIALGASAAVVVIGIAALAHALSILLPSSQGNGASSAVLGRIVLGEGHTRHLRADWLAQHGMLALLGIVAMVALCKYLRDPLVGFVIFTGAFVLVLGITPGLFALLADAISLPQAARIYLALPWPIALAGGSVLLARMLDKWWNREAGRPAAASMTVAITLIVAAAAAVWPADTNRNDLATMPPVVVVIITVALALGILWGIPRARAARRRDGGTVSRRGTWSTSTLGLLLVALIFAAAPVPALTKASNMAKLRFERDHGPLSSTGIPNLTNRFDRAALKVFPTLKPGSIVLADLDSSYRLSAVAPVYVVGSVPGHIADTLRNRRAERAAVADSFFHAKLGERAMLKLLDDEHVDYLVASTADEASVIAFAQRHPDLLTTLSLGRKTAIFAVRHGH